MLSALFRLNQLVNINLRGTFLLLNFSSYILWHKTCYINLVALNMAKNLTGKIELKNSGSWVDELKLSENIKTYVFRE